MTLPGTTAPRMDLVVCEQGDRLAVVFWEAKCADNKSLRSSTTYKELRQEDRQRGAKKLGPSVMHQAARYESWFYSREKVPEVEHAYRETARILLGLSELTAKRNEKLQCVHHWRRLSDAQDIDVITRPAIVIANYSRAADGKPVPYKEAKSFETGGHRAQIERLFKVHSVERPGRDLSLPAVAI